MGEEWKTREWNGDDNIGGLGRGGVGVRSVPCNRKVEGSNIPQATE